MTDEMMIEPQVRQKSPVLPTLVSGGLGAAAAYGGSYWYEQSKGAKSYEELVAEVKDKTDFSSKKEPAKWSDFKKQAEKVAELERKLAETPEKVLPETDALAIRRKDLQIQFDQRLAQMVEAEEARLGSSTTGKLVLNKELASILNVNEAMEINTELQTYSDAVNKLRGKDGGSAVKKEFNAVSDARKNAKTLYNLKNTKTLKSLDSKAKIAAKEAIPSLSDLKSVLTNTKLNDAAKLAYAESLAEGYGNIYTISTEKVKNTIEIPNAYGTGKSAWVSIDTAAANEARTALKETYIANAGRYKEITKELDDIAKGFLKDNSEVLKDLGITDVRGLDSIKKLDGDIVKNIKLLEMDIARAEAAGSTAFNITDPLTKKVTAVPSVEDAKEILEKAQKKYDISKKYIELRGPKLGEQARLVAEDPLVAQAKSRYKSAIRNNSELKQAVEGIKNKLVGKRVPAAKKAQYEAIWAKLQPLLEAEGAAASGTVDKAALEQLLKGQKLGQDLEKAIADYNAALTERGVTNTAAKEALQKEANAAKAEAQKLAEGLAHKKLPKGWIAAGVGAACAVIALMCSNKNN